MKYFITGTDTEVGKTYCSVGLTQAFNQRSLRTVAIKPIASGAEAHNDGKLYNADALALQNAASIKLPYEWVNPLVFVEAIAPHIAAKRLQRKLSLAELEQLSLAALQTPADIYLIEGAGGWYTPLNDKQTLADFAIQQNFAIILVVGIKLGCINHALLTQQAIVSSGAKFAGWIANCLHDTPEDSEIIRTLEQTIAAPCLGIVKCNARPEEILQIDSLLN